MKHTDKNCSYYSYLFFCLYVLLQLILFLINLPILTQMTAANQWIVWSSRFASSSSTFFSRSWISSRYWKVSFAAGCAYKNMSMKKETKETNVYSFNDGNFTFEFDPEITTTFILLDSLRYLSDLAKTRWLIQQKVKLIPTKSRLAPVRSWLRSSCSSYCGSVKKEWFQSFPFVAAVRRAILAFDDCFNVRSTAVENQSEPRTITWDMPQITVSL